ncbi:MAG: hypothetical protein ACOX6D_06965 [Thermoguttaceae bacterium]|jgi:hypothetical protein
MTDYCHDDHDGRLYLEFYGNAEARGRKWGIFVWLFLIMMLCEAGGIGWISSSDSKP